MKSDDPKTEILFEQALAFPTGARAAFLAGACHGDSAMQRRLEALLAAHEKAAWFLPEHSNPPLIPTVMANPAPNEVEGTLVGRYKLLEKLGEGGFGSVWAAEQREPVRRRVALKIIKLGMDTKQVVARFLAERQALALMDHPNIAKVLDAGATDSGRPFFVMELVKGIPIIKYCNQEKLDTAARLDLFINVCHAIQHAHQKGVIHRDIKPSNILVTLHDGVPVPKVIDFGIAKATQGELTDQTIYTQVQQFIGTPAYMSPEQAEMSGLDVDTRSDIYSLGVLLYELLTGVTPFDTEELMHSGLDEMRRIIREREPVRPSTRLSQTRSREAQDPKARVEPGRFHIDRDLDWIVMKCLEKDRTRRYDTANGLALELKRYLNHEPVTARPPSTAYRVRKAWMRNRVAFTGAALVIIAVMVGAGVSTWQAIVARDARNSEAAQRHTAEAASRQAIASAHSAQQQKSIAEENARTAEEALHLAEKREMQMLRRAYAADLNLAHQAIKNDNLGRGLELLNRYRPEKGKPDIRGWEWRYLWQLCQSEAEFELCRLPGPAPIYSIAVSPDSRLLALGADDEAGVQLWDFLQRRHLQTSAAGEGSPHVAFSPDGRKLAFSTNKRVLRILDCATLKILAEAPTPKTIVSLAFSADGSRIVSYAENDGIIMWEASNLTVLKKLSTPAGQAWLGTPFAVAPDGGTAVRVFGFNGIALVDLDTNIEQWRVESPKGFAQAITYSPDGRFALASFGLTDGTIRVFETETGREVAALEGHSAWVSALVFWPDGKTLASASADQTIRLWDMEKFKPLRVLRGHQLEIWSLALTPDGERLVSGSKDGAVLVWEARKQPEERSHWTVGNKHVDWAFTRDRRSVYTLDTNQNIMRWSGSRYHRGETIMRLTGFDTNGLTYGDLGRGFSPSGTSLACIATNGLLTVWNLSQAKREHEFPTGLHHASVNSFTSDESRIWLTQRSAPDAWVFSATEWDLNKRQLLRSVPSLRYPFVIHDSRWVFTATGSNLGSFQDLTTEKSHNPLMFPGRLATFFGDPGSSDDGRFLVVSHDAGLLTVWATSDLVLPNPQPIRTVGGILMSFSSGSFSSDGSRLFGTSHGKESVKIWETTDYNELLTLASDADNLAPPRLSADGRDMLASGLGTLYVWRAASWDEIAKAEKESGIGMPGRDQD